MQPQLKKSKATVSPVKTCRNHKIPAAPARENNQELIMCEAHSCCVKGHFHARKPAQGATRRLKENKISKPRPQKLCKVTFHVDCHESGDHFHTDSQCVCAIRAAEVQDELDGVEKKPVTWKFNQEEMYDHLDLNNYYGDLMDQSEDEDLSDESDVDFDFAAFNAEEEVKTPIVKNCKRKYVTDSDNSDLPDYFNTSDEGSDAAASHTIPPPNSPKPRSPEPAVVLNTEIVLPSSEEKKVPFETADDIEYVSTPSHQRGPQIESQRFYKISRKAYRTLNIKFPNPYLCVNFLNSAMACLRKEHVEIQDHQVFAETVSYFINNTYLLQQACRTPTVTTALTQAALLKDPHARTFIQPSTLDYSDYIRKLGLPVQHGSILRVYGEECKVPADLTYNGNWLVLNSKGFNFSLDRTIPIGTFNTQVNEFPRLYRTQFTRISGVNDFTLLDANGKNVSLAMSRLTKARPNESELRTNQLRILTHMTVDQVLLSICSNETIILPREVDEGKSVDYLARRRVGQYFSNNFCWNPTWKYSILSAIEGSGYFVNYLFNALAARLNYVTDNYVTTKYNPISFTFKFLPEPSPKRKIYHNWFERILGAAGHYYSIPISAKSPEAKFKKELSKPGKHGRLYVTYNESILSIGWIFTYLKSWFCVDHRIEYGGIPLNISIRKALDENSLYDPDPPLGLNGQIFSDDMSFQYRSSEGLYLFDADISSCDSGNTVANFYILAAMTRELGVSTDMIKLSYDRLKEPILIRNPSNPKEFIKMQPRTIFQGSGCPETTIVNDVASTSIAIAMQTYIVYYNEELYETEIDGTLYREHFDTAPPLVKNEILQKAALSVGHVITVDEKKTPEELQFLKYSPFLASDGSWVNTRNLGAILRSLGSVDGDITPIMLNIPKKEFANLSFEDKMEMFMSSVVAGLVNEPKSIIMNALRERFPSRNWTIIPDAAHLWGKPSYHSTAPRNTYTISTDSFISRYGGTLDDWTVLANQIRDYAFGFHFTSPLVASVMEVDYGLLVNPPQNV